MNGCMYIARWDYFKKNKSFHSINAVPYIMPQENSIEIDSLYDYKIASAIVENALIDLNLWK